MIRLSAVEASLLLKGEHKKTSSTVRKAEQANKLRNSAEYALSKFPGYTTELQFHPTRKWRFDYAWEGQKIAVEVHGGVYRQGRHTRGEGFTNDREKMNEAALLGWTVIEVTPEHIKSGQLAKWLTKAFQSRGTQHVRDDLEIV